MSDAVRARFPGTIRGVMEAVAARRGVSVAALRSASREHPIVQIRQEAMYCARALTTASLGMIGRAMGNRDHTTVLHAIRAHAARAGVPPLGPIWGEAEAAALRAELDVAPPAPAEAFVPRVAQPSLRRARMVAAVLAGDPIDRVAARYGLRPASVMTAMADMGAWAGTREPADLAAAVAARITALEAEDVLPDLARACVALAAADAGVLAHRVWSDDRSTAVIEARRAALRLIAARSRAPAARIAEVMGVARETVRKALAGGEART